MQKWESGSDTAQLQEWENGNQNSYEKQRARYDSIPILYLAMGNLREENGRYQPRKWE